VGTQLCAHSLTRTFTKLKFTGQSHEYQGFVSIGLQTENEKGKRIVVKKKMICHEKEMIGHKEDDWS